MDRRIAAAVAPTYDVEGRDAGLTMPDGSDRGKLQMPENLSPRSGQADILGDPGEQLPLNLCRARGSEVVEQLPPPPRSANAARTAALFRTVTDEGSVSEVLSRCLPAREVTALHLALRMWRDATLFVRWI